MVEAFAEPEEANPVVQAAPTPQLCPHCQAPRHPNQTYCHECGVYFDSAAEPAAPAQAALPEAPAARLQGRYQLLEALSERQGVTRFRGLDYGAGTPQPVPIVILQGPLPPAEEPAPAAARPAEDDSEDIDILPSFDLPATPNLPVTEILRGQPIWPSIAWERALLSKATHTSLPDLLDTFVEGGMEYLVEEAPVGQSLWDAWDDPATTYRRRFTWLKQIAEALDQLHQHGAILEGLRPDIVVVTAAGRAVVSDLADLLPLPLPPNPPIRATLYTAPELVVSPTEADARADLYSFGAMLYALHVGRELSDTDFDLQNSPKPFIPRFPDIHPAFGRLVTKTFSKNPAGRFPTDEAGREDATGFQELIRTLDVCGRTLDNVRLEMAAWTTTGIIRTGNEDAFALLHAMESRQDDLRESALVLLADGMGGYEAGEVAAALAIQALRKNLLQQPPFALLAGQSTFPEGGKLDPAEAASARGLDVEACKKLVVAALKDANKQVYQAARTGIGKRGMGCTSEVVFITGQDVVVGHVGDSRTYHLKQGRLVQITRDQTLVNRLIELGTLTPEEAETHPRRSELQQAVGGRPEVDPDVYHSPLKAGDWIVVCSDGVSNHITPMELQQMLQSEATSAEMAARRLVNFVNIKGATDNATVVVVRLT
ncbi:MAG: protein phosphatase 2C domain-containing protein [Planctomycetes bacterium]|nr:protein phosphatase 2C domain-containing protein [Planctomycetota bacterium]